ncbi:MAG: OprO/OprP family phosphate-selective porin [Vicinamibacterales bacterium]
MMSVRAGLIASWIVATAAIAAAQTTTQTPAPPVAAGWQDGFFLQSSNGENRLVFGLNAQVDARLPLDSPDTPAGSFSLRKMRPTFSGRVAKYFEFKVMPDFGGGTAVLQDAYIDVRISPKFRLRSGKDKTPVGYELLLGDPYLLFPERSIASLLVPNRDLGFQAQGDLGPRFSYSGGLFNGIPDGISSTTDDTNGAKDLAARVVWQPFRSTAAPAGALNGLGFHLGGSIGKQQGALPSYRTLGGLTYFSYASGTVASGSRDRISPAVFYYYKSFGGFAEYTRSTQDVLGSSAASIANRGWEVTGSYVLTGEAASDRGVRPQHNFDPQDGQWGAFQIAARYSELHVDPAAFSGRLASATSNERARAISVGADWYPNTFLKYYAAFERTSLDGGVGPRRENVILIRAQLLF